MGSDSTAGISADAIRRAVDALYTQRGSPWLSGRYQQPINPQWLATPRRRRALWIRIARIVAADPDYGCS